jgi:tetratricopeptide (TPR) repeat protein
LLFIISFIIIDFHHIAEGVELAKSKEFVQSRIHESNLEAATASDNLKKDSSPFENMKIPDEKETIPFPKYGIRLSYLIEFIERITGNDRSKLVGKTTDAVSREFVVPLTKEQACSYCELLLFQEHPAVGIATIFISHAWRFQFLDVVDALTGHFARSKEKDPIIWFDLFSNNQNKASDLPFEWWCTTFKSAIAQFHHTVMVLAPWDNPVPLTRAWCLYELFCTLDTGSKFEIALSEEQRSLFFETMKLLGESALGGLLATIDCEKSTAFKLEDQQRILKAVKTTVGFNTVNSMIFKELRSWVLRVAQDEVDQDTASNHYLLCTLGELYRSQGNYLEAEKWHEACVAKRTSLFGENNKDTLDAMNNLGLVYDHLHKYEKAEALFTRCLNARKQLFGVHDFHTIQSMNNLALIYYNTDRNDLAEPLYREAVDLCKKFWPSSAEGFLYMYNLANLYSKQKKYTEAEELLSVTLLNCEHSLGKNHPDTLDSLGALGQLYAEQGKFKESEPLLLEALQRQEMTIGVNHPVTERTFGNLVSMYLKQENWKSALEILSKVVHGSSSNQQEKTVSTLSYLNMLGYVSMKMKNYSEAIKYFAEYIELLDALGFPPTSKEFMNVLVSLGNAYYESKQYEKAENEFLLRCQFINQPDASFFEAIRGLVLTYQALEEYEKANVIITEFYFPEMGDAQISMNVEDPFEQAVLFAYTQLLMEKDPASKQAETLLLKCYEARQRVHGDNHSITIFTLNTISTVYFNIKNYDEYARYSVKAYQDCLQLVSDHLAKGQALYNYATMIMTKEGNNPAKVREAESLFIRALAIFKKKMDYGNIRVRVCVFMLVDIYVKWNDANARSKLLELNSDALEYIRKEKEASKSSKKEIQKAEGEESTEFGTIDRYRELFGSSFQNVAAFYLWPTVFDHQNCLNTEVETMTGWLRKKGE